MSDLLKVQNEIKEKNVLFISTKNLDYIRVSQEIKMLNAYASKVKIVGSNSNIYFKRILKVFYYLFKINYKKYDIIFIGFAPQLILPFWYLRFKKKVIIIDFFISLYDTLVDERQKIKRKSLSAKFIKFLDKITLKYANIVIVDSKAHGNFFCDKLGLCRSKIRVIYLEANYKIFYPRLQEKRLELEKKFVTLYFGSVLPLQGVDVVLNTLKIFKNNEHFFFQIIGPIGHKYEKPQQNNVEYIDWLEQEELAKYISNADLCLAGHFNNEIGKAFRTIPGKAYIYNAMKRPMILGEGIANKEVFKKTDSNIKYVVMGSPEALAKTIYECGEEFLKKHEIKFNK